MSHDICLNMIVKNEAHVIAHTLDNLCKYINFTYYVISDTGSTDNTIEVINNFFNEKILKVKYIMIYGKILDIIEHLL
jgi:glycosyltransferase involved in cell wall biosynthesis